MPIILAAQEGEIMRIAVLNQPRKIVCKTLSQKNKITKESDFFFSTAGVAQGVGPEFKPQYLKKKDMCGKLNT
jgi:hypothetical protein